jgi:cell division protein FtsW (lipid II flippase)
MANKDFYEFFLPSTIPDRKSAARAVAAGFFAGFIMFCVFAVISVSLIARHESTSTSAVTSTATIVMILVTVGTWKRFLVAPVVGLIVALMAIVWELSQGKVAAIVLIVPLIGGFWTAARGIAALKQLRRQASIQQTQRVIPIAASSHRQ